MARKTAKIDESAPEAEAAPAGNTLVKTITTGAADACSAAANLVPATGKVIRKSIYSGFYYVTYGVVFSSLMIGNLIPSDNAMGEGVHDGAAAARKAFKARQEADSAGAAATASA